MALHFCEFNSVDRDITLVRTSDMFLATRLFHKKNGVVKLLNSENFMYGANGPIYIVFNKKIFKIFIFFGIEILGMTWSYTWFMKVQK
jgi:hypothetical protein